MIHTMQNSSTQCCVKKQYIDTVLAYPDTCATVAFCGLGWACMHKQKDILVRTNHLLRNQDMAVLTSLLPWAAC